jgi:SAM-dependent methyltransferase
MNTGGFSAHLKRKLLKFNGGLFYESSALAVTRDQLELLIEAAKADWRDVEPAIFGTLLERALSPEDRHKLGAHYTPRAYVERLVMPTIIEPVRAEWDAVRTAAINAAQTGKRKEAIAELEGFHDRLCELKVLDPACGSGNFLYVTLEHLKRIEGEVFTTYESIAERQLLLESGHTVDPHQLLGLEINPRAAAIADLVLWIGYLQWHYRTRGNVTPPEPVLKNFKNIECRDALLKWSSTSPQLDDAGKPVTRWNGRTTKPHPVTGEEVPDETARAVSYVYYNPQRAEWPRADYIVGNPPFIGTRRMRLMLGDGYVDAITKVHTEVPENADYVMYWWNLAAISLRSGNSKRFGLITTNSISQAFNRATLKPHLTASDPVSIVFAIPDHPWVDATDGAAVRVAMTIAVAGASTGELLRVASENEAVDSDAIEVTFEASVGAISDDLRVGASPASAVPLVANSDVTFWGTKFYGDGFIVSPDKAQDFARCQGNQSIARPFVSGRDLTQTSRNMLVLDCDGMSEEELRDNYPSSYQHLLDHVKPVRQHNPRAFKRERWWIFGENQPGMRRATSGLQRYFATTETAKHRVFQIFPASVLAEGTVAVIAIDDCFYFGVLSSRIHVTWALAAGGRLGVGNDPRYNKTVCFEPFPFPAANDSKKAHIRELGEQLDARRKRQQELHPKLTMTGMYNVLEKLRSGEALTTKEQEIHEQGLVSVLKEIHDELDAAVAEAYGWPVDLADEDILARLVALNHERAEEERRGIVRWLRPEFQNPGGEKQKEFEVDEVGDEQADGEESTGEASGTRGRKKGKGKKPSPRPSPGGRGRKKAWPKGLAEQAAAVQGALVEIGSAASVEEVAKCFTRANRERVEELLDTLASLGKARELKDGRFVAV